ncbi:conjugative transposon protein TraM [Cesiribacter andamanensis]|uniref:Conjugative transposon TraM protein n=1 Tax=Cesiribacter andamanensis AMV16 TaxID=1279009 RepID=M7NFX0_9BACT|nr:conjugative transposon protein TraM [Cesiribacter andamanensis]EMR00710.1 conjugative transposon TraM protein [Cesiribacter andamanensis AMV16]
MDTKPKRLGEWMRRHWLPLSAGLMGLLLLGAMALGSIRRFQATTPIASIAPDQPASGQSPPSRLDRYRKELEDINRQHARRQRSLETIISMDFGSMSTGDTPTEAAGNSLPPEPAEQAEANSRALPDSAVQAARHDSPSLPQQARRPRQQQPASLAPVPGPADPFQTVRAKAQEEDISQQKGGFYSVLVHGDQKLLPNATLCLRLQEEIAIGEHRFPRHTLLYGRLSLAGGGRLKVRIASIGSLPLRLRVYDQDFQEGIAYLQEEPLPSALAESRDDALDQMLFSLPYGGVASGLAGLGRNLLRKSRRGKSLFLADGYPLFVAPDSD